MARTEDAVAEDRIGGEITMQCEIARGITMAWQDTLGRSRTRAELDREVDLFMTVVGRQKAKIELGEKRQALLIAQSQIKESAERRIQLDASFRAEYEIAEIGGRARRGGFKLSEQQKKALEQCDEVIKQMRRDVPLIEAQIARLEALIDGRELPDEAAVLREAAE